MAYKTLGLIPAKGASTRLPMKNVKRLAGKPLLQYSVDAARESGVIDELIVSTESSEVAGVANDLGCSVIARPDMLSVNPYGVEHVALHALEQVAREFTHLIILLPTSPFRTASDIRQSWDVFHQNNAMRLMTVCQMDHSPYSSWSAVDESLCEPLFQDKYRIQSQKLPKTFRCNGAVHILDIPEFIDTQSYTKQPLFYHEMPRSRSVDIDTQDDWDFAEWLLQKQRS